MTNAGEKSFLSLDVLTTGDGKAIPCNQGMVEATIAISTSADGPFTELPDSSFQVRCTDGEAPDVALVVDNSGSEEGFLPWLQNAAQIMLDKTAQLNGRASLVRVSTDSEVRQSLTDDFAALRDAVNGLFINNGWTALYDGIRVGNETLGEAALRQVVVTPDDLDDFCTGDRKMGVVVFTDANENNSCNEMHESASYPGDGCDTTLEDLQHLKVNGVQTPIYTVGLGGNVDHTTLKNLAESTGGRHHRVDDETDLPTVFGLIADYVFSNVKVCTELPNNLCGELYARIDYVWRPCDAGETNCDYWEHEVNDDVRDSRVFELYVECPIVQQGRIATLLLTLSNPQISSTVAATLATNAVAWVSNSSAPRVLVVKDDNHHGEFEEDAKYVYDLLSGAEVNVAFLEEPKKGIKQRDVEEFDVVWLSNPGYPPDDKRTLRTLLSFAGAGGGVVLQGDDFTWFWGDKGYSMTPLTGLIHRSNGTRFCGKRIDNNATSHRYRVAVGEGIHPLVQNLQGEVFLYGDDIDTSHAAAQGEVILANADGVKGTDLAEASLYCSDKVPVISVRVP